MLPRALRALLEGPRGEPGREQPVVLSAYRPRPPPPADPPAEPEEEEEEEEGGEGEGGGGGGALFGAAPPAPPGAAPPARRMRAAPLPRLVRHLLEAPARGDAAFVAAFLGTYRAFARPGDVLRLLLQRLEETGAAAGGAGSPEAAETQRALSALLCSWLESYPEDFGGGTLGPPLARRLAAALAPGSEAARRLAAARASPSPSPASPAPGDGDGDSDGDAGDGDAEPLDILCFPAREVAEELTRAEAELFVRLVPYECLGSLWSRRDKAGGAGACASVRATVRQFNRLAGAVVRSCLAEPGLRPPQRARLLEKWIRVAEECRALRNFSSLCAIVSALRSSPVHRLRHAWDETARDAQRSYAELSAICSEQDNYSASRRLLFQDSPQQPSGEGTPRRQPRRPQEQRPMGVVPYLGTFLRDLVMLDAAMKDELENGYINFEKRRKEFEVLTQVRLLQSLCRNYRLRPQPRVRRWLRALRPLSEAQSHSLSCEIEPPDEAPPRPPRPSLVITHCAEPPPSLGTSSVAWEQPCPRATAALLATPGPTQHVKWPSVSALDGAPGTALSPPPAAATSARGHRRSASCGSPADCRIIRARMELHNGSLYKSILVTSQDKTPAVVAKVLEKHGQDGAAAGRFQLVQLLPEDRELPLPPSANVFYAMDGASADFALRPRDPPEAPGGRPARGAAELSATFPKIKATGRKITRALF